MKSGYALILCLAFAACSDKPPTPVPVYDLKLAGRSAGAAIVHKGDSFSSIARRYRLTVADLIRAHGGEGMLHPNQRLVLPPPRSYTVRPGDTLVSVAGMFDLRTRDLIAQNDLQAPYGLRAGQILTIPDGEPRYESVQVASLAPVEMVEAAPLPDGRPLGYVHPASAFAMPVQGRVISGYGIKKDGLYNDGINIAAPAGTAVRAAREGTVVYAGNGLEGFGNLVLVRHKDGFFTVYGHLADTRVARGVAVSKGQALGSVGTSGKVSEPQLHFEIRKGTKSLNPADYL